MPQTITKPSRHGQISPQSGPTLDCDNSGDIMQHQRSSDEEDGCNNGNNVSSVDLLTFPQIWVESVCESSDEEEDNSDSGYSGSSLSKRQVLRSFLTSSVSTDVSFDSLNSSGGSSRQGSFREDSTEEKREEEEEEKKERKEGGEEKGENQEVETPVAMAIDSWLRQIERQGFNAGKERMIFWIECQCIKLQARLEMHLL